MNQIFYLYYIALTNVGGALKGNLSNIKSIIDPTPTQQANPNVALDSILSVLSFGIGFLPPPFDAISGAIIGGVQVSTSHVLIILFRA